MFVAFPASFHWCFSQKKNSHDCGVPPTSLSITQKVNDKCYARCVTKPSTALSSSEEVRIQLCLSHAVKKILLD